MTARDPGAATGTPPRPLLPPCGSCPRQPHSAYVHLSDEKKPHGRGACVSWHGGRCGCKQYVPKEET